MALEDAVWAPVLGTVAGAARCAAVAAAAREQRYVQHVLVPLLGPQHIPPQQPVQPSLEFVHQLLQASGCLRSPPGEAAAAVAVAAGTAVLMPDVTRLPDLLPARGLQGVPQDVQQPGAQQQQQQQQPEAAAPAAAGPVVCVELKPKCGFICACATVHPANHDLKHSRSRYQLHQLLKLSQARWGAGLQAGWRVCGGGDGGS